MSIIWKTEVGDEMLHFQARLLCVQLNTAAVMQK